MGFAICGEDIPGRCDILGTSISEVINMDTVKIGSFLAQLRKERGLTQEQL